VAGLSRHRRHELARKRRRWARDRPGAVLRTAGGATLAADLESFFSLHRSSAGVKAGFMTPAREAFFREIARRLAELGVLRLDLLEDQGRPLAASLGFQTKRTFLLYNAALEPAARALSPGIVLTAALIDRAIGDGLEVFDFLRGTERYKLELGGRVQRLQRARIG
jgi:CelD/BcsL family acetyltransferase involved in cellulose biosynthesis